MASDSHLELLAQIASMYYEQEMTQNAIANELGLSRVKVYRLLKQARLEQVVQISINWPVQRSTQLEQRLKQAFRLDEALVLNSPAGDPGHTLQQLGQLGKQVLHRSLTDGATMAVCLGRSTFEVINAIQPDIQAKVRVAQAMGSMPFRMQELDSATLARQLARKLGGDVLYLSSPLMADSVESARVLRSQRDIEQTLAAAREADVALLGIGNLDPAISGFAKAGFISATELKTLIDEGAVGDIAGQIYGVDGKLHPCSFNHRLIAITLDEVRQIPIVIAVAVGKTKAKAILGGLRTKAINVLCIDTPAAEEVLKLNDR